MHNNLLTFENLPRLDPTRFKTYTPMLATLVKKPFTNEEWIFEIKWDGYRAIARVEEGEVQLYSRKKISFAYKFTEIVNSLKKIDGKFVIDGEIVVLDRNGNADFGALQNWDSEKRGDLAYFVFDILELEGKNLTGLPLVRRKQILTEVLGEQDNILINDFVIGKGEDLYNFVKMRRMEGIIAKHINSVYEEGYRSDKWQKIKNLKTQEVVIGGYTRGRGSRKILGALLVGIYEGDLLKFVGHTGGGFDERTLGETYQLLKKLEVNKSPFADEVPVNMPAIWVRPELVAEVEFSQWTTSGRMRQPIFKGLRFDKSPREVIHENPRDNFEAKNKVTFTHVDRIYFPKDKITKAQVIDYYKQMGELILPYLSGRPQSLNRHPNGIDQESFYQKDIDFLVPNYVKIHEIYSESNNKNIRYMVVENVETILFMANLGCIELNPWISRVESLEKPDFMLIDLDPDDNKFAEVVEVALVTKTVLENLGVASFVKTSGKTGLHILVPMGGKYTYGQVRQFAEIVANIVHRKLPEITSVLRNPEKRRGKIYVDYLQNRKGQTMAAPYSIRPVDGAPISTPLFWRELTKNFDPRAFNFKNIFERLNKHGDIFGAILGPGEDIGKNLNKLGGD